MRTSVLSPGPEPQPARERTERITTVVRRTVALHLRALAVEHGAALSRLIEQALIELVKAVMESRPHPEQGYRSCLGIMRLGRRYGDERLEAACNRALAIRGLSYRSVESILKHGLDREPLPETTTALSAVRRHENLRGPDYYH